jgi:4-aminobutyrate aminotransferase-like enzyme
MKRLHQRNKFVLCLEEEKTLEHVYEIGRYLMDHMLEFKANHKQILLVRGIGLMIGIELDGDGTAIVDACREKKLLINCTQGNVLRLMPALNIKKDEVDQALAILGEALS